MREKLYRYGATVGIIAGSALPAFAQTDADGVIGTLDFTALAANAGSVVGQAFPVGALVAGIGLGLAFVAWAARLIASAVRTRSRS